ncbi:hypothetical protein LXL04_019962 [Taraxacum kok-saghyz]
MLFSGGDLVNTPTEMTLWKKARLKDSPSSCHLVACKIRLFHGSDVRRFSTDMPGISLTISVNHSVFSVGTGWIPLGDISVSCKHMSTISVPIRRYDDIRNELTLMWFRPYCKSCELDGRTCGLRSDDVETACFVSSFHAFFIDTGLKIKQKDNSPLYNHTLATILVESASAGFEFLELIVDVENCLQAFVGVADDLNAIIIAFRGTQETSNFAYYDHSDISLHCFKVHHGFFNAYNNTIVRSGILDGVSRAKKVYGDIIQWVGPWLLFVDLIFRIGNAAFASYYSEIVPNTFRIRHEHDLYTYMVLNFVGQVISNMRSLMTEENNVVSNSFLLDDDSNIPFSVDDISRSMDQIEISDIEPPPLIRENSGFSFLLPCCSEKEVFKEVLKVMVIASLNIIWEHRNGVVFDRKALSFELAPVRVQEEVAFWIESRSSKICIDRSLWFKSPFKAIMM